MSKITLPLIAYVSCITPLAFSSTVHAADPVGYQFSPDTPIRASEINANFQELADRINSLQQQTGTSARVVRSASAANGAGENDRSSELLTVNQGKTFILTDVEVFWGGTGDYCTLTDSSDTMYLPRSISAPLGSSVSLRFASGIPVKSGATLLANGYLCKMLISGYEY